MGRLKTLDAHGWGMNKSFPPKYLLLADIEKKMSGLLAKNVRKVSGF